MKRFRDAFCFVLVVGALMLAALVFRHVWDADAYANYAQPVMTPRVDSMTGAQLGIDYPHHEIHGGSSFAVDYSETTAATDDHRTGIAFTTPAAASGRVHFIVTATASQPAEFFLLESAVFVDGTQGTPGTVMNRFRGNANTSAVSNLEGAANANSFSKFDEAEFTAATFTGGGTGLAHGILEGGSGPFAVGGASRGAQEWILDASTIYCFYIQNIGANANTHNIEANWYEHVDGGYVN